MSVDVLSVKHELSPEWAVQKVKIKNEVDNLDRAIMESVYSFKLTKVRLEIDEIQFQMSDLSNSENDMISLMSLINRQKQLDLVKLAISEKLGRRII